MLSNLRNTQKIVNSHFAYHAFDPDCASCKITVMKVKLKEIRGDRTLEEIADEIGVEISTVQRWEKHSMNIPSSRLEAIARAYRCSVKDIFDDGVEVSPATEVAEVIEFMHHMDIRDKKAVRDLARSLAGSATHRG